MDIIISVVGKVAEYIVAPIGRQASYSLFYKCNLKKLADHVKELEGVRERTKHLVEEERRNGKEIESDVENWLDEVNKVIERANEFQNDPCHAQVGCSGWLFPNCISRHQLSRKATKIAKNVVQAQGKGKFDGRVGYLPALDGVAFSATRGGEKLETRESFKEDILKALKDSSARIIGVYGLGGVGKTTLVKEVAQIAKEDRLFDVVVIGHVSENPDIRKLQDEIADMLHLRFDEQSVAGRAYRLKQRINTEKSILVILDNIWNRLDLEKVGIPSGDESNGCKLLMTSRNEHVLLEMQAQKDFAFKLELLNEKETWNLFQFMAGDVVNDISLKDVATKVTYKCGGLPLAIVTMARTLRNEDICYWEDALQSLDHADIDSVLEFSYNRFESEEMKELFLLFALVNAHPEYHLRVAIGLNIFKGLNSVRDARNRLHRIIGSFKSYCLLLENTTTEYIQMHDIVRKVAISIACRDKHVFLVKEWPIKEFMPSCCTQIILNCHIPELPQRLDCPNIELFFLYSQNRSLEIPNTFFEDMGSLKVLHLHSLNLSLPTSFQSLTSLQMLSLDDCVLENMEVIGDLKSLEILRFWKSSMNKFPSEIRKLTQLRILNLSHSGIEVIPPNIISSLTKLEELNLENTCIKWGHGNSFEQNENANLGELRQLSNLTTLELQVREARILPKDLQLVFEKLKGYKIAIGDVWEWYKIKNGTLKTLMLKLRTNIRFEHGIKALIKGVENLYLDKVDGIENVLYQLNDEGFPLLKNLHIQNNPNMKHIVDTMKGNQAQLFFTNLETLVLQNLRNLEQICHGPHAINSFGKLSVIKVKDCVQLRYLLSFSMVKEFSQLSEIEVCHCYSMKGIMLKDSNSSATNDINNEKNEFLSLRSLTLEHLQTLDSFFSYELMSSVTEQKNQESKSYTATTFFNAQVVFPNLGTLRLNSLHISKVWDENQHSLNNLTSLIVENCGELKYLLSTTMIESLRSLKRLEISNCHLMTEIIATDEKNIGSIASKEVQFLKLETIILKDMKNLKTIWHCNFDTLRTLQVVNCEKIVVVFPTSGQKTYCNLEMLEVKNCALVEEIFELISSENSNKEVTTYLKEITLAQLPKLKKIWSMDPQGILSFHNLENVDLHNCGSLEYLFPFSVATCSSHLKKISIQQCGNMKEIVAEKKESTCTHPIFFKFNQLNTLHLVSLNKLEEFYAGSHTLTCPSLRDIGVLQCTKLNLFKTVSTSNLKRFGEDNKLRVSMHQAPFTIEEVIPNLEKLQIDKRDAEMILQAQNLDTLFTKMTRLGLSVFMNEVTTFPYWFLQNAHTLEWLAVEGSSFEKIFQDERLGSQKIHTRLKDLTLLNLHRLQQICEEGYRVDPVIELLEYLRVLHCPSLKNLLPSSATFNHLTYLKIAECNGLIYLITSSTARSLAKLKTMFVENCNSLEEIIKGEEDVDIAFTSLERLMLQCLPRLNKFCSGKCLLKFPLLEQVFVVECPRMKIFSMGKTSIPNLRKINIDENGEEWRWNENLNDTVKNIFEDKISFCKFKSLTLSEYPELKDLWYGQPRDNVFRNLKCLVVQRCDFLSHVLFPSNLLQVLHGLEEVEVRDCDSLEELFDVKGMKSEEILIKQSSGLKRLTLCSLPNLKKIWNDDPYDIISFGNLCTVDISVCESLLYVFPASLCYDLGHLETLKINSCGVDEIVAMEERSGTNIFKFPLLTNLTLWHSTKLKRFYPEEHILECPSLKILDVFRCEAMRTLSFNHFDFQQPDSTNGSHDIQLHGQALFPFEMLGPNLEELTISGRDATRILNGFGQEIILYKMKDLCLQGFHESPASFLNHSQAMFPNLVTIHVYYGSFEKLFPIKGTNTGHLISVQNSKKIRNLWLFALENLKHIWEEDFPLDDRLLQDLETLSVDNCPSLISLVPSMTSFTMLTELEVINCKKLVYLITSSTAKSLVQLTRLVVKDCEMILDVVKIIDEQHAEEEIIFDNLEYLKFSSLISLRSFCHGKHTFMFPSLTDLYVEGCPELEIFSSGVTIAPYLTAVEVENERKRWKGDLNTTIQQLFLEKVAFCNIKSLTLSKYPKLKDLWYGQPHDNVFRNLKSLVVERCDFLSHVLLPSNLLEVLRGLEEVEVRDCDSLEALFDVKGMKSRELIEVKQSSRLKRLTLSGLPKLKQIWNDDPYDIISFENLCTVDVSECQSLLFIFPSSLCKDLGQLEKLKIESCGVEEIVAAMEEGEGSIMKCSFSFPQLTEFRLIRLMNLKNFYIGNHTLECPSLKVLNVYRCEALRLFSFNEEDEIHDTPPFQQAMFSIAKLSPNLDEVALNGSDVLRILNGCCHEMILHKVKILRLQCFDETPTSFLKHLHAIFPNLVTFQVRNSSFETLFPSKGHLSMQISKQMRNLWLFELENLKYIWEEHFPLDDPFLQQLEDLSVWNCPSLMSLVPPSTSFTNLTELEVGDCKKLVYLITSSTAKSLVQLTSLVINNCEMILDVVKIDEQNAEEEDIIFQNLEQLKLTCLSSLRSFCYGKHTFKFPSLLRLCVEGCPQMEIFSSGVTIAPYLTAVEVENERKHSKGDLNTTIQQLFIEKKEASHPEDK